MRQLIGLIPKGNRGHKTRTRATAGGQISSCGTIFGVKSASYDQIDCMGVGMDKWGSYEFCVSWFGGKPKETLRHSALELFGSGRVFVLTSLPVHEKPCDWSDTATGSGRSYPEESSQFPLFLIPGAHSVSHTRSDPFYRQQLR